MSTQSASACLLARIAQAALEQLRDPRLYVAPAPPNLFLGEAHIELLQKDPTIWRNDPGSVARVFEISRMVDCIQDDPALVKTPDRARFLSHEFPQVLANVKFSPAPLSEGERQRYERAIGLLYVEHPLVHTPAYDEFCALRADLELKDVALGALRLQLARATSPEARVALENELALLEPLQAERRQAVEALDRAGSFSSAEQIINDAERTLDRVPESVARAVDNMDLFQDADVLSGAMHASCRFFPASLSEDNWARLELTRADLERFGVDDSSSGDDELDESQIDSIELEVQTLVCDRPWFWPVLFENTRWTWANSEPLRVSNGGALASDNGLIPAYVHALTFARNLTVRGRPSTGSGREKATMLMMKRLMVASSSSPATQSLLMRAALARPTSETTVVAAAVAPAIVTSRMLAARPSPASAVAASSNAAPVMSAASSLVTKQASAMIAATNLAARRAARIEVGPISIGKDLLAQVTMTGRIVDENDRPVSLATLTIDVPGGQRSVSSGTNGAFTFTALRPGKYSLSVAKSGYATLRSSLVVPQSSGQVLRLQELATCELRVRLIERTHDAELPFTGSAKITLQGPGGTRIENVSAPESTFRLPAGATQVSVTSIEAATITPAVTSITLGAAAPQTLTFHITRAPLLQNQHVQLLAVACRRLPRCPEKMPGSA